MKIFYKGQKIKSSYKNSEVKSHMAEPMKIIAIYTFDSATPCMPVFSNVYGHLGTDINNGDGTTTRIIRAFDLPTKIDFRDLGSLISVEYLNTSNVTDMNSMFYECTSLTSIDASNWDTSNVTNMELMFYNCCNLTSLDLSNWQVGNVTDMCDMFWECRSLESLDLSNWDTSSATNIRGMFDSCESLRSINVSNWDTSNVTDMSWLFEQCYSLETIIGLDTWDVSNVTDMNGIFAEDCELTTLNISNWSLNSELYTADFMFYHNFELDTIMMDNSDCNSVNRIISELLTRTSDSMGTLIISEVDDINQIDTATAGSKYWNVIEAYKIVEYKFDNTIADLVPIFNGAFTDYFIVDQVNDNIITRCVYNKKNIITLEKINLTNVEEDFKEPYYKSNGDIYFDEIGWHVVGYDLSKYINGDITVSYDMIVSDDSVWSEAYNHIIYSDSYVDSKVFGDTLICETPVEDKIIHFERTYQLDEDKEQAVFLLEGMGMTIKNLSIKVVNSELPTKIRFGTGTYESTDFDGREKALLEVLYLDNRNLETEEQMFQMCTNLTKVKGFVSNIMHKTNHMFLACYNLISIDTSNWDTSNVQYMQYMFCDCESLTSLDVSNFDTRNVTAMYYMFYGCISLTSLDLSNFDTSKVTDMASLFRGCSQLTQLDVDNWDVSSVVYAYGMFYDCSRLVQLNLNNWDTSNVVDVNGMFNGCSSLTRLYVSGWDTKNVTNMNNMFANCTKLIKLDLSNWNTGNVINMSGMFYNCSKLTTLDISNFDTSKVIDISYMFANNANLKNLNIANFDLNKTTEFGYLFTYCNKLDHIDCLNVDAYSVKMISGLLLNRTNQTAGTVVCKTVLETDTLNTLSSKNWNVDTVYFILGKSKLGRAKLK